VAAEMATKEHVCFQGPLCEVMTAYIEANSGCDDAICRQYGCYCPEPTEEQCDHWSCHRIVNMPCEACYIEAFEDPDEAYSSLEDNPSKNY